MKSSNLETENSSEDRHLHRASSLLGLDVLNAEEVPGDQRLGRVMGLVFDPQRLVFCVLLEGDDQGQPAALPVRDLDWSREGALRVKKGGETHPMTEHHLPLAGLTVRDARTGGRAYVHDLLIDPHSSRVAEFQLTALPCPQHDRYTLRIPGQQVERLEGELTAAPEVLSRLIRTLHQPVVVS